MRVGIVNYIRQLRFRIRWVIMSDRDRYAYLWNRTRMVYGHPEGKPKGVFANQR